MKNEKSLRIPFVIRPLLQGEIGLVERHLPFDDAAPGRYYDYFALQLAGEGVSLIAWQAGLPAGHALLRWQGTTREPMASQLRDCPHLSALLVHPDSRSRGIGTRVMEAVETLAFQRGYRRIGLNVDIENARARALYTRRGYREAGFAAQTTRRSYLDLRGYSHIVEATCIYLIKPLAR